MGKNSKIEWTNHIFNPWWGCTKVSEACKFCLCGELVEARRTEGLGPSCATAVLHRGALARTTGVEQRGWRRRSAFACLLRIDGRYLREESRS